MPLAIDLYCGLGGWAEGLLAEGWDVLGFDNEIHVYGDHRYPAQMVCQDVRTLHGSQFKRADLIVASPPCTEYSYMAMPWTRAKQIARALRGDDEFPAKYRGSRTIAQLNELWDACWRIQAEASEAKGEHVPMVVENVVGAQKWVGKAHWHYGSFYLWGDVPELTPITPTNGVKVGGLDWSSDDKAKRGCFRDSALKVASPDGGRRTDIGKGARFTSRDCGIEGRNPDGRSTGRKVPGNEFGDKGFNVAATERYGAEVDGAAYRRTDDDKRQHIGIKRRFASAMIAKIPFELARHIGRGFHPERHFALESVQAQTI